MDTPSETLAKSDMSREMHLGSSPLKADSCHSSDRTCAMAGYVARAPVGMQVGSAALHHLEREKKRGHAAGHGGEHARNCDECA